MIEKSRRGFTLIELMIVIAVIAILATIIMFGLTRAQAAARDVQREQLANSVRVALERYLGDTGAYPATGWTAMWTAITTYIPTATDPGCGATCATCNIKTTAAPCGTVTYAYTLPAASTKCTGSPYEIVLTKESGGTLNFCGPR